MKRLIEYIALAGFATLVSACMSNPVSPVNDAAAPLADDQALVAFSVSATRPVLMRQLDLEMLEAGEGTGQVRHVPLRVTEDGSELYVYRLPAGAYRFGSVRFATEAGWWETRSPGPEFVARPGSLTYLGRFQLHSVKLSGPSELNRRYLTGVNIKIEDATEEDSARLSAEFNLPQDARVLSRIPASWGASEFMAMRYQPIPGRDLEYYNPGWGFEAGPVGPEIPAPNTPGK
jgi:hypothetical protein